MKSGSFIAPPAPADGVEFAEAQLWAGDLVIEAAPTRLSTVLGSCVSVCLYDKVRRFGGMNHFLVPTGAQSLNHGDWSTEELIRRALDLGAARGSLVAKVFGGGSPLQLVDEQLSVGPRNVVVAYEVLARHGIPVASERVGLRGGLRVFFENWTGLVWLRHHQPSRPAHAPHS